MVISYSANFRVDERVLIRPMDSTRGQNRYEEILLSPYIHTYSKEMQKMLAGLP